MGATKNNAAFRFLAKNYGAWNIYENKIWGLEFFIYQYKIRSTEFLDQVNNVFMRNKYETVTLDKIQGTLFDQKEYWMKINK